MAVIVALNVISSGQAPIGEAGSALTVTPVTWMGCADGRAVGLAATDVGEAARSGGARQVQEPRETDGSLRW